MEVNRTDNVQQHGEMSFKDLIKKLGGWYNYLLSRKIFILVFIVIGGILGFTYASFKKIKYVATTTFVLEESDKAGGLSQYAGLASMAGIDLGGGGGGVFQGDNILELYNSRKMIEKTLLTEVEYQGKKQLLVDRYIYFNKLREKWIKNPKLENLRFQSAQKEPNRLQDSVLSVIINDINNNYLKVEKADKKSSIIKAVVSAPDEFFAKAFNENIVNNVNMFYVQTKTKKSTDNINILQQKTDSVRAIMNGAIFSAANATDATPNLNVTRQVQRIAPVQRSQASIETNKLILGELVKNLELSKIAIRKETPLIQVIDEPVLPLNIEKLSRIISALLGGAVLGFFAIIFLCFKITLKNIMSTE